MYAIRYIEKVQHSSRWHHNPSHRGPAAGLVQGSPDTLKGRVSVGLPAAGGSRMRPQVAYKGHGESADGKTGRKKIGQGPAGGACWRNGLFGGTAGRVRGRGLHLGEHEAPDPGAAQPEAVRRHAAALAQARKAAAHRRAPAAHRQGHAGVRAAPPAPPGEKRGRQAAGHKIGFRAGAATSQPRSPSWWRRARAERDQVLLGVTGSGKTFTMAKVIEEMQRPALILAPNKTLAAQLYGEFKSVLPR